MKTKNHLFLPFLGLILFCLSACHKDPTASNYSAFPIQAKGKRTGEGVKIEWEVLKSNELININVWRSNTADSIPDNFLTTTNSGGFFQAVGIITDFENTFFIDNTVLQFGFSGQSEFYYRVEAKLKGRSVLSRNIKVRVLPELEIPFASTNRFAVNSETGKLYCFENTKTTFSVLDAKIETLTKLKFNATTYMPNATTAIKAGNYEGKPELYLGNTTGTLKLFILNAETLETTQEFSLSGSTSVRIANIQIGENGIMYLSTSDSQLWIIDRKNPSVIQYFSNPLSTSSSFKWRYYYNTNNKSLVGFELGNLFRIATVTPDINTKKLVISTPFELANQGFINFSSVPNPNLLFLNNGQILIDQVGNLVNENLNSVTTVIDQSFTFGGPFKLQMVNNEQIVYIQNPANGNRLFIHGTTFSTIKFVPTIFFPQDIFVINNEVWLVTTPDFTTKGTAFLEKVRL